jgi:hypothetical protein
MKSFIVPHRQFRWEMIGPVFENHFGVIFRFPVNMIAELEYDFSKWI